jgi:hypothetical protein
MKLYSVLLFFFVFTIDVRLRAFDSSSDKIVETPDDCLNSNNYCIIKNLEHKFYFNNDNYSVSMSPNTVIVRQKAKEISFVKGQLFIKTKNSITLDIPYGQIEIDKDSQVILDKLEDKVVVQTIFGKTFLKPLGEKKPVLVMEGHENYLAEVNDTLKAQTGIPKPILVDQLLKTWAYHSNLSKEKFLDEVRNFKTVHETAVKDLSILNEQIASREITSAKEEKEAELERANRAKEHKAKMQKSYYEHLLGE